MEIINEIRHRFSPMQFRKDAPISAEQRELLFEAARWAPSSFNEQPWRYIWADHLETPGAYNDILSVLSDYNQQWASTAPLLVVAVASERLERNSKTNAYALYDTGMSVANMVTQAVALGMQAHQMGGFDAGMAVNVLGIHEGYRPVTVIAFGYPDDAHNTAEPFRERALETRTRKPAGMFVMKGKFRIEKDAKKEA